MVHQRRQPHLGRHRAAIAGLKHHLSPRAACQSLAQQRLEARCGAFGEEAANRRAHDLLQGPLEHVGESPVAVVDDAVAGERDRAFFHLLDQRAIGMLGPFEGEDALAFAGVDDQGIDRAGLDRVQRLLGLRKFSTERFILLPEPV